MENGKHDDEAEAEPAPSYLQLRGSTRTSRWAPEDELAKDPTHDLEMNFCKIAPLCKEDTAKELQDHATKTQDTLVDAVGNAAKDEAARGSVHHQTATSNVAARSHKHAEPLWGETSSVVRAALARVAATHTPSAKCEAALAVPRGRLATHARAHTHVRAHTS